MNRLALLSLVVVVFLGGCVSQTSYSEITNKIVGGLDGWELTSPLESDSEFRHPTREGVFIRGSDAHLRKGPDQLEIMFMEFDNPEDPQEIVDRIFETASDAMSPVFPLPDNCAGLSERMGRLGSVELGTTPESIDVQTVYCIHGNVLAYIQASAPPGTVSMNEIASIVMAPILG